MKICVVVGSGTAGGTQKAAALYAAALVRRGHDVQFPCATEGVWSDYCRDGGVRVIVIPWTAADLATVIEQERPDIIHHHTPGTYPLAPLYEAMAMTAALVPFRVIESNIFARLDDPVADAWLDHRLFVSLSSGVQAHLRAGRRNALPRPRESVVFYPAEPCAPITAERRASIRKQLGVAPDDVLAIRLGRPDPIKWASWDIDAFLAARRKSPNLRLLLMEPPSNLRRHVDAMGSSSGIIVRKQTDDPTAIMELNQAADILLHAPSTGEGFGFTLAEGMIAGLPVIVRNTPFADNAQGELVENGVTGFVCASIPEMGRRLAQLAGDPSLRERMGRASRSRILAMAGMEQEIDVLESVLHEVMTGERDARLAQRDTELAAYFQAYNDRLWRVSDSPPAHPLERGWARLYAFLRNIYNEMRASQYRRKHARLIRAASWPPADRLQKPRKAMASCAS